MLLVLAALAAYGGERAGLLRGAENAIVERRMAATPRAASGDFVFLAIDSRSLQEVGVWPWPREIHAELIRRLFDLGAAEVFLDIDFSAASDAASDAALAEAMAEFGGGILLPAFRQKDRVGGAEERVNLPLAMFRDHVWLASVNVSADADGRVRRYPFGQVVEGNMVPSAAAALSGRFGPEGDSFPVNFSLLPETVPAHAVIDLLTGRIGAEQIAGRSVVIGAHAIELRDNMAVPVHGIMSGAMLHILAAETLRSGIVPTRLMPGPLALVVAIFAIGLAMSPLRRRPLALFGILASIVPAIEIAGLGLFAREAMILPSPVLHLVLLGTACLSAGYELDIRGRLLRMARIETSNMRTVLERIVADSSDAILVIDSGGLVLKASARARTLFEMQEAGASPSLAEIVPPELYDSARAAMADFREGRIGPPALRELVVNHGDRRRHLEYTVTPSRLHRLRGDAAIVGCIIVRDVSVEREQRARAEEAARSKSRFLAMMSHEIRTPMNGVLGMAEVLAAMPLSAESGECVATIRSSGRSLLAILNDILEMSKLEQNVLTVSADGFDLREALEDVVSLAAPLAEAGGLRLHLSIPGDLSPFVVGDEDGVRKIATNLVGNAIKFTERGHVLVEVVEEQGEGTLTLRVSDTGPGIEEAQIDRIFEPFHQGPDLVPGGSGGTGLGLAIARVLADQMRGEISVRSRPGEGSTFSFTFPAERGLPVETTVTHPVRGRFGVLAADPLDREIVCEMVRSCGGIAVPFETAEEIDVPTLSGAIVCQDGAEAPPVIAGCPVLQVGSPEILASRPPAAQEARTVRPLRRARLRTWLHTAASGEATAPAHDPSPGSDATEPVLRIGPEDRGPRLLVVDDSGANRLVVKRLLQDEGFRFLEAANGAEACAIVERETVCGIFMDVSMPVMDGLEATARIRAGEARTGMRPVPIFGLTAHASAEDLQTCRDAGMDDVVAKPVSRRTLLELLAREFRAETEVAGRSVA